MMDLDDAEWKLTQELGKVGGLERERNPRLTADEDNNLLTGEIVLRKMRPTDDPTNRWKVVGEYSESLDSELHESLDAFDLAALNLSEFLITYPFGDDETVDWDGIWTFHISRAD